MTMTAEEKAMLYDKALERAKLAIKDCGNNKGRISMIESIFPELEENRDERIREEIHIYLDWLDGRKDYAPKGVYSIKDMIAWIEKQGKTFTKKDVDDAYLKGICDAKQELEKQCEQKPILDFKASNWYVSKVDGKIHDLTYNPTDKKELKKLTQSVTKTSEQVPSILDLRLMDCPFSVKTMNAVKVAINKPAKDVTLGDIIKCNKSELLALRNFGKVSLKELEDFLADYGLKLEGE